MSDLDLDAIREQLADPLGPNLYDLSLEVPRLVAEVERLRTLADDNWRSLEREATEHARTLGLIGQPKTGEPLSEGEQRRFEAAVERGLRKRAEDQRDDVLGVIRGD